MQYEIINDQLSKRVDVTVSKSTYRIRSIIKVLYNITDSFFTHISEDTGNYIIHLTFKDRSKNTDKNLYEACGKLVNELADQELRQIVIEETGEIRNTIVKKAFLEAAKGISNDITSSDIPKPNHSYVDDFKKILTLQG